MKEVNSLFGSMMVVAVIALILVTPVITISAINELFEISLEYDFLNYISVLWLTLVVGRG